MCKSIAYWVESSTLLELPMPEPVRTVCISPSTRETSANPFRLGAYTLRSTTAHRTAVDPITLGGVGPAGVLWGGFITPRQPALCSTYP